MPTQPLKRWQAWVTNLYDYEEIEELTGGVRLRIVTPDGTKPANLPSKYIKLYRHLKEVEIPEWLCRKIGI